MVLRDFFEREFVCRSDERVLVADDHVNASIVRLGCLGYADNLVVIVLGPPSGWRSRVTTKLDAVAILSGGDHNFRSVRPPDIREAIVD
jgi:hypothetical protein